MSFHAFLHVSGTFVLVGKQPDGDSVRFVPDDPHALDDIYRAHLLRPSRVDGSLQLRLDGIDAPETHYGSHAQPLGDAARDHFLKQVLGFTSVTFQKETVTAATPETITGAILTQAADPHGRPIAYVMGAGQANPFGEAQSGTLPVAVVRETANARMVRDGLAYALLYTSMPKTHRTVFSHLAQEARKANRGVWAADKTPRFALQGRGSIEAGSPDAALIFPKLFRRATDYLTAVEKSGFDGNLSEWLAATPKEDDAVVLDGRHEVPLSTLVRAENDRYRFDADTTSVVFVER